MQERESTSAVCNQSSKEDCLREGENIDGPAEYDAHASVDEESVI